MFSITEFIFIAVIFLPTPPSLLVFAATETGISRLRKDLLTGYDRTVTPTLNHNNATTVNVSIYLDGFDLVSRKQEEDTCIFTAQIYILFEWYDDRLEWNPDSYNGLKKVQFSSDEIWKPDLTTLNNVDNSGLDQYFKIPMIVTRENISVHSKVYWEPLANFQVWCNVNFRAWPFDGQECDVVIGLWTHSAGKVDLISSSDEILTYEGFFNPNREWEITERSIQVGVTYYLSIENHSDLLLKFRLKRRSAAHVACIVMPGFVIIVSSLVSFWLPPGSRERTSILILSIFINIFYLYNCYRMIPNNGSNTPLVVLFFRDSLVMLAFSLITTVCLRYLANIKREEKVPLTSVLANIIDGPVGKILCLNPRPELNKRHEEGTDSTEDSGGSEKKNAFGEDWAWLAHLLDRITFTVFLIVYLCLFLSLL